MIPPCLTLSNIRYVLRVKWRNPGKGVAPSPTPRCTRYWKGRLLVALDYGHQLYFTIIRSGLLVGIRWSFCMLKSHRSLCVSFSRTGAGLCVYHWFVWSNWNFLHIFQWTTLSTQSCSHQLTLMAFHWSLSESKSPPGFFSVF